ncbi:acyl-protein synthetase [uncultured Sphaerochaeta sp.]|uniref:LuxE/PaaK family acyltransferase n=1 Tax=uncultured Sphaerochaeta sp. TaxID=886478 RepID=UPI002A0A6908|nr:acyl-protein synthetase [uncultured Sphaerochaeta sp.]
MYDIDTIQNISPFSMGKEEKGQFLTGILSELTLFHYSQCNEYKRLIDAWPFDPTCIGSFLDIPYLPVRLFKEFDLRSVGREDIVKEMTSSGTTGQEVSRIFLDKETATNQTKILVKIVSDFIGVKRIPMIILDSKAILKDRNLFSARGAGILGFSIFGSDKIYALDEEMHIDFDVIDAFLEKHSGEPIFLFGFTFMVWQHFYKELLKSGKKLNLANGILIHGGGWKKLIDEAVDNATFKEKLKEVSELSHVYNYYGMVEQTGTVYMECEYGHLHTSVFSDVIIRDPRDFSVAPIGQEGLIEVVSILPKSYPGHVLLTEDSGRILGEDDCPCGRKGKYFSISGRIKNAEIRGCSDAYAARF